MLPREIRKTMKENEKFVRMLEEYDRTGKPPWGKIRRSFTLKRITVEKLKEASEKTGKSMSDIIDKLVDTNNAEKERCKR
jgi:hypothetical protein